MQAHVPTSKPFKESLLDGHEYFRHDFISGILVFLIALPLSIGIARASNFPPTAGVLAAIIGGLVVTFLQGSYLTIKGPAAGLVVIVYSCVSAFGGGILGYEYTLAAIVLSGIIQIILGLFRTGTIGDIFPSAVVQGMLASIGLMIIFRQTPVLLGAEEYSKSFLVPWATLQAFFHTFNPYIAIIGVLSLLLLFIMPVIENKYIKLIPAPMLVVAVSMAMGYAMNLQHTHQYTFVDGSTFTLSPDFLVDMPTRVWQALAFPNFGKIFSLTTWKYVLMLALVGSVESIASAKAVDILDPERRKSDLNKDLFALGIGNMICGFMGALPIINEMVRSSANIQNGAKTRWSNFYHGLFLLLFVAFAGSLIHRLPLTAVAALLIYTGFRLCTPKLFLEMYKQGRVEFIVFIVTIVTSFAYDILIGILTGTTLNFLLHLYIGTPIKSMFFSNISIIKNEKERTYILYINDATLFSNFNSLKNKLDSIPHGYSIIIDFSNAKVVDNTAMEHLHYYGEDYLKTGGILVVRGMENLVPWSAHPLSLRVLRKATDAKEMLDTSREKQLKALAKKIDFKYYPHTPDSSNIPLRNDVAHIQIKYEANILMGNSHDCQYRISDISFNEMTGMKAGIAQLTILAISNLPFSIPVFTMSAEGLMDKFWELTFIKTTDIDFTNFPTLSKKYLLQGINETDIRAFFQPSILQYLESNTIYHIESTGHKLIIYKQKTIANAEQILSTIAFAQGLVKQCTFEHSISQKN